VDLSEGVVEGKSGAILHAIDIGNAFSVTSRKYTGDYSPGKQASYAEVNSAADRKRNEVGRVPLLESLFAYCPSKFLSPWMSSQFLCH